MSSSQEEKSRLGMSAKAFILYITQNYEPFSNRKRYTRTAYSLTQLYLAILLYNEMFINDRSKRIDNISTLSLRKLDCIFKDIDETSEASMVYSAFRVPLSNKTATYILDNLTEILNFYYSLSIEEKKKISATISD